VAASFCVIIKMIARRARSAIEITASKPLATMMAWSSWVSVVMMATPPMRTAARLFANQPDAGTGSFEQTWMKGEPNTKLATMEIMNLWMAV